MFGKKDTVNSAKTSSRHNCLVVLPNDVILANRFFSAVINSGKVDRAVRFIPFIVSQPAPNFPMRKLDKKIDSAIIWEPYSHQYYDLILKLTSNVVVCDLNLESYDHPISSFDINQLAKQVGADFANSEKPNAILITSGHVAIPNPDRFFNLVCECVSQSDISVQQTKLASPMDFERFGLRQLEHESELKAIVESITEPTICFIDNAYTAVVLSEFAELNDILIPDELSIVALSDNEQSENLCPSASIYQFPVEEIAGYCAMHLDGIITGKKLKNRYFKAISNTTPLNNESLGKPEQFVAEALQIIDSMPVSDLTIAYLTKQLGVSRSLMQKMFRQTQQNSPGYFLAQRKLREAKTLIRDSRYSMREIASHLGFASTSSFSRFFQKHEGVRPTQWVLDKQKPDV